MSRPPEYREPQKPVVHLPDADATPERYSGLATRVIAAVVDADSHEVHRTGTVGTPILYGDDQQAATNYPLVRLVNQASGHVFYTRTHNPSTMAVATGSKKVSTKFDVPANAETGLSQLFVVANGIPSSGYFVNVQ